MGHAPEHAASVFCSACAFGCAFGCIAGALQVPWENGRSKWSVSASCRVQHRDSLKPCHGATASFLWNIRVCKRPRGTSGATKSTSTSVSRTCSGARECTRLHGPPGLAGRSPIEMTGTLRKSMLRTARISKPQVASLIAKLHATAAPKLWLHRTRASHLKSAGHAQAERTGRLCAASLPREPLCPQHPGKVSLSF